MSASHSPFGSSAFPVVVVGAGITGCTVAERVASQLSIPVLVLERRDAVGGNSRACIDPETGIERHEYGSHIFHTTDERVWRYANRFTSFNAYRHKVLLRSAGRVWSMPVNLKTLNDFFGTQFSPDEARAAVRRAVAEAGIAVPSNLEEKAVSLIGRGLYERLIAGYTAKQWGRDPKELPESIINRLPVRYTYNDDYFDTPWQGIPADGFSAWFDRLLANPKIEVRTGVDFLDVRNEVPSSTLVVYTGEVDRLFGFRHGPLEWRSLRFEWETVPVRDFQGTSVVNYGDRDVPWTRIHEFKHYHREWTDSFEGETTLICREFPQDWREGLDAFYPVDDERNAKRFALYRADAEACPNLLLGGRFGAYRYWDMDKAIAEALDLFEIVKARLAHGCQGFPRVLESAAFPHP